MKGKKINENLINKFVLIILLIFIVISFSLLLNVLKGQSLLELGLGKVINPLGAKDNSESVLNSVRDSRNVIDRALASKANNLNIKEGEFLSNEILIKVKPGIEIKEGKSDDVGVTSLNKLNNKNKIKNFEKISREAKNSKKDADIFRWYRLTIDKEAKVVKANGESPEEAHLRKIMTDYINDPNIENVEFNYIVNISQLKIVDDGGGTTTTITKIPNDPYYHSKGSWGQSYYDLYGIRIINPEPAWGITTGQFSVIIAVIDTGVDRNHPDLQGNMWVNTAEIPDNNIDDDANGYIDDYYGWDFTRCSAFQFGNCIPKLPDNNPMDDNGHGTHVTGTIAAVGDNNLGVVGVNWKSSIMALKFLTSSGSGFSSDAAEALRYAADMGAKISSNSWGGPRQSSQNDIIDDALNYEYDRGMIIVVSAGNSDFDSNYYSPASSDRVMTVAASDPNDARADFSNWGKIEIAAPGVDILSLKASRSIICDLIVGQNYCRHSGTSMAAPHVAGLAGLILSYQPNLNNIMTYGIIQTSADDIGTPGHDIYTGYGRINVYKAFLKANEALTKPEPLIDRLQIGKLVVASGAPFNIKIIARNAGKIDARNVLVELFDGNPDLSGIKLAQWIINLTSENSKIIQQNVILSRLGEHKLYATIDRPNDIVEVFEGNNKKISNIVVSSYQIFESPVTTAIEDQYDPSIYSNKILWTDWRNGNPDIYIYDILTKNESKLILSSATRFSADIFDKDIVYVVFRNFSYGDDVYLYNLKEGVEKRITTNPARRQSPSIYKGLISWAQSSPSGSYSLYLYDLGTDGILGTNDCNNSSRCEGEFRIGGDLYSLESDIYNNKLVWDDIRNGNLDIYMYDLGPDGLFGTGDCYSNISGCEGEFQLTNNLSNQWLPSIWDNKIVWVSSIINGPSDIFIYDLGPDDIFGTMDCYSNITLGCEGEFQLANDGNHKTTPYIYNNKILWADDRNFFDNIYLYDISTKEERRVSPILYHQYTPKIFENTIVWSTNYQGSFFRDIYSSTLDYYPSSPKNLIASSGDRVVTLNWNSNTDSDLKEYAVYRGDKGGGPYSLLANIGTNSYFDKSVTNGVRYYYRITAIDLQNGESGFSNEASAVPRTITGSTGGRRRIIV